MQDMSWRALQITRSQLALQGTPAALPSAHTARTFSKPCTHLTPCPIRSLIPYGVGECRAVAARPKRAGCYCCALGGTLCMSCSASGSIHVLTKVDRLSLHQL